MARGKTTGCSCTSFDEKIKEAIALRRQITGMQANTVEDVEAQDRMLREANEKIDRLKCAADMLISAEFVPGSAADRRAARDDAAIKVAVNFHDSDLATFHREPQKALGGQVTFHWPLEFPEVMVEDGGFDALIGNPPFMGGLKIIEHCGRQYRPYLVANIAAGNSNTADLCAYFFLRAFNLIRSKGCFGLLATNTIGQGDTCNVGLERILASGGHIFRAISSRIWPGTANVFVSHVWVYYGPWASRCVLDDSATEEKITSNLTAAQTDTASPLNLAANQGTAFQGSNVLGMGFVMPPGEAASLIARNPKNEDVLFPYINGDDLNPTYSSHEGFRR